MKVTNERPALEPEPSGCLADALMVKSGEPGWLDGLGGKVRLKRISGVRYAGCGLDDAFG